MIGSQLSAEVTQMVNQVRRRIALIYGLRTWPIVFTSLMTTAAFVYMGVARCGHELPLLFSLGCVLLLSVVGTCFLIWRYWPTEQAAAFALDRAFDFEERITTLLYLDDAHSQSPSGLALQADTKAKLGSIKVESRFPLNQSRRSLLAPLTALALGLVAFLTPWPTSTSTDAASAQDLLVPEPPKFDVAALAQKNEERKERVKEIESEKLDQLQSDIDKLFQQSQDVKDDKGLQDLVQNTTKIQESLRSRQSELQRDQNISEKLRRALSEEAGEKQTSKAQEALAQSDFEAAKRELQRLMEARQSPRTTDAEKKRIDQQLGDLQRKLEELANQGEREASLNESVLDPEAKAREQAKLDSDRKQLKDLKELADKLQKMQQSAQQGDKQQRELSQQDLEKLLDRLERNQKELDELADAMQDMQELRQCLG